MSRSRGSGAEEAETFRTVRGKSPPVGRGKGEGEGEKREKRRG